jgi:hypothetical protein
MAEAGTVRALMEEGADASIPAGYVTFEREVLHDNIALCDQKSGFLLALAAGLVVFCLQSLPIPHNVAVSLGRPVLILAYILNIVAVAGFAVSAYLSLHVIAPRFRGTSDDHIFWRSGIFALPQAQFLSHLGEVGEERLIKDMAAHLHVLARICSQKYRYFAWALYVGEFAFVAIVLAEAVRLLAIV